MAAPFNSKPPSLRYGPIRYLLCLALALAAYLCQPIKAAAPPDIVFIVADDLGFHGSTV